MSRPRSMTPPAPCAPIFSTHGFLQNPVRIPPRVDLRGLQNGRPWWIPIFDTTSLFPVAQGGSGMLAGQQSAENNFIFTADFAWLANMASTGAVGGFTSGAPFQFQMTRNWIDANGEQQTYLYQKTPIHAENIMGAVIPPVAPGGVGGALPFYLRKPSLLRAGDELTCRVQSLQPSAQAIQIVLFGYVEG